MVQKLPPIFNYWDHYRSLLRSPDHTNDGKKAFVGIIVREHCRRQNIIRETDEDLTQAAIQHTNRYFLEQSITRFGKSGTVRSQTSTIHSGIEEDANV